MTHAQILMLVGFVIGLIIAWAESIFIRHKPHVPTDCEVLEKYRLKIWAKVPDNPDMVFCDLPLDMFVQQLIPFGEVNAAGQDICIMNVTKIEVSRS
jgi:hypothetical protein